MRWPRDTGPLALLAALPLLAQLPALAGGRLLGPGDGGQLHYPLRALVWSAWRQLQLPAWDSALFSGTPLLASYRPGALAPQMLLLSPLPPFLAFQVLVLFSLSATGVLSFLYVRRLGTEPIGAYVAGLFFSLGPYLMGHMGDTPTLVAAPCLPLVLLAAESHMNRATPGRALGLSAAIALLLLSGSPEAAKAGLALVVGRIAVGHLTGDRRAPPPLSSALAIGVGALLAAPQLVPSLLALPAAGRQVSGLVPSEEPPLPGLAGLVLRYASHTPAPALALAALPLARGVLAIRVLGLALLVCLGLQYGRGPLAAPGALALVFDFALAVLAGISLSAQWRSRREPLGRRLRLFFLVPALAASATLSIGAATLGPLPETLAGAVGVLAVSLILYFTLATDPDPVKAGVFLLPLSVSFLLQPHGRDLWATAPTREQLAPGSATRQALERAMSLRPESRVLTIARGWPEEAADLGFPNGGALTRRRSAHGYEPMVPLRNRMALEGMGPSGLSSGAFLRSDPRRLELLGVRFVALPASALRASPDGLGFGEPLELVLEPGRPRFLPVPLGAATLVRLRGEYGPLRVSLRLATGRELPLGDTTLGPQLELPLPGRYYVDGLRLEARQRPLALVGVTLDDGVARRTTPLSAAAGYVSDAAFFRELAATPGARLFELPGSPGYARVVASVRGLRDDTEVLQKLAAATRHGVDPRAEALGVQAELRGLEAPAGGTASAASFVRSGASSIELRAAGPGVLVVAEGYDPGWSALVDDAPAPVLRVNHAQLGVPLGPGIHRVLLRQSPRGFAAGLGLLLLGALVSLAGFRGAARGTAAAAQV
ncbi:MAG: hypothetical protein AB7O37_03305 [Vicinamibacteria bacterium]